MPGDSVIGAGGLSENKFCSAVRWAVLSYYVCGLHEQSRVWRLFAFSGCLTDPEIDCRNFPAVLVPSWHEI